MFSRKFHTVFYLFIYFFQPFSSFAANLERDPTRPSNQKSVVSPKQNKSPFSVTAIMSKGGTSVAIVNQRTLAVGDEMDGWLVTDIQKDYVQMRLINANENGSEIKFRVSERVNVKN